MNEFQIIRDCFAPLAKGFPGALDLRDDAALLDIPPGQTLVATKDAIEEGVHFIGNEPPSLIARKLLRSNLSDLAAMGAAPYAYLLHVSVPHGTSPEFFKAFAQGLAEDQKLFGIHLAGGDTTSTLSGKHFSVTALGLVPHGQALKRSGAKIGEDLYVSGTIGDGFLGLQIAQNKLPSSDFLHQRYLLPQPRLALGLALRGIATACLDVSDGLAQDALRLCEASACGIEIDAARVPLSDGARATGADIKQLITGGDDYELLFSAPAAAREKLSALEVTRIGRITPGNSVVVLETDGQPLRLESLGYRHF